MESQDAKSSSIKAKVDQEPVKGREDKREEERKESSKSGVTARVRVRLLTDRLAVSLGSCLQCTHSYWSRAAICNSMRDGGTPREGMEGRGGEEGKDKGDSGVPGSPLAKRVVR